MTSSILMQIIAVLWPWMKRDEEGYDDQTSDAWDHEEENWEPHWDEHGSYVFSGEDCEDIDQHPCEGDEEFNTAFLHFQDARDVIFLYRQLKLSSRSDRITERRGSVVLEDLFPYLVAK